MVHKENEMIQVGGSASITSIRSEEESVGPKQPKLFLVNLLEDKDDIGELVPGSYILHAGIVGSIKLGQNFKPFEVKVKIEVEIN